jgi:hypothetical protein
MAKIYFPPMVEIKDLATHDVVLMSDNFVTFDMWGNGGTGDDDISS